MCRKLPSTGGGGADHRRRHAPRSQPGRNPRLASGAPGRADLLVKDEHERKRGHRAVGEFARAVPGAAASMRRRSVAHESDGRRSPEVSGPIGYHTPPAGTEFSMGTGSWRASKNGAWFPCRRRCEGSRPPASRSPGAGFSCQPEGHPARSSLGKAAFKDEVNHDRQVDVRSRGPAVSPATRAGDSASDHVCEAVAARCERDGLSHPACVPAGRAQG